MRGIGWLAPLRPKLGLPVMLAIVAPWLILITIKTQGAFFAESVGHDMMAKVAGGQESKGFPPGYYTLLFPVTFWPWSLLALPAIPWVWNNRRDPAVLFCLAWIIPSMAGVRGGADQAVPLCPADLRGIGPADGPCCPGWFRQGAALADGGRRRAVRR